MGVRAGIKAKEPRRRLGKNAIKKKSKKYTAHFNGLHDPNGGLKNDETVEKDHKQKVEDDKQEAF